MEKKFEVSEALFENVNGRTEKFTGKAIARRGAPIVGCFSKYRDEKVKSPAKYSSAALFLNEVFDGEVSILEAATIEPYNAYVEFTGYNSKKIKAMVNSKEISFLDAEPDDVLDLGIALTAFAVTKANTSVGAEEIRTRFEECCKDYEEKGIVDVTTILAFCDSVYYGFAKDLVDLKLNDELVAASIRMSYEQGLFNVAEVTQLYSEFLPSFEILEGVKMRPIKKEEAKPTIKNAEVSPIIYEWDERSAARIPDASILDDFVETEMYRTMRRNIQYNAQITLENLDAGKVGRAAYKRGATNFMAVGDPSSGKSVSLEAIAAALRMPFYQIPIQKNTEEDAFQGMTKVIDGGFKFVETDFLYAFKHGGIIVLEEINLADPAVTMGALGQAIEAPYIIMEDGYKPVERHPLCFIVGTMNVGTYGSKGVSQALSSRFKQTYVMCAPKREDFINILIKKGYAKKQCAWVYDAYEKIIAYLKNPEVSREELCLNVTLRGCIGALECMAQGDSPKMALANTLVGKIAEVDLELAETIKSDVIDSFPDLLV